MPTFLNSPVVASLLGGGAVTAIAFARAVQRMFSRLDILDTKLEDIANDVTELKSDKNIVRWSELAQDTKLRRRGRG